MKRFTPVIMAVALTAVSIASARPADDPRAQGDFQKLITANLQEAQTLHDELPTVNDNAVARRVWKRMITEHEGMAAILEREDRRVGGSPDLTKPAGTPSSGDLHQVVRETLEAHRTTLSNVQGMMEGASHQERKTLRKMLKLVRSHIIALRDLGG